MELTLAGCPSERRGLMARDTYIVAISHVATMVGENLELLEQISVNPDNIDYGEMIYVATGPDEGIIAFTAKGIESLQELIGDIRTWRGGIKQFLINEGCEPEVINRIMKDEPR